MSKYESLGVIDVEKLAEMFKALSSPHRLRIFARLSTRCCPGVPTSEEDMRSTVRDISLNLGIAPSTVSHHLKELRQVGLIKMHKNGQDTDCWVEPDTLKDLTTFFGETILELGQS